jgi:hypothetical protein
VHFAKFVDLACELEDPLGGRGFAGVHVSEDADVAILG